MIGSESVNVRDEPSRGAEAVRGCVAPVCEYPAAPAANERSGLWCGADFVLIEHTLGFTPQVVARPVCCFAGPAKFSSSLEAAISCDLPVHHSRRSNRHWKGWTELR